MSENINFTINLDGNIYTGLGNINKALNTVNASVSSSLKFFDKLSNSIFKINTIASGIQSVNDAIGGITQAGANAELQLMNLKTLFGGNAEAANDMYERISEYGKVTPYDKAGLIEAQRTMMSFGIEAEYKGSTVWDYNGVSLCIRTVQRSSSEVVDEYNSRVLFGSFQKTTEGSDGYTDRTRNVLLCRDGILLQGRNQSCYIRINDEGNIETNIGEFITQ